jgi:hypothetical protein
VPNAGTSVSPQIPRSGHGLERVEAATRRSCRRPSTLCRHALATLRKFVRHSWVTWLILVTILVSVGVVLLGVWGWRFVPVTRAVRRMPTANSVCRPLVCSAVCPERASFGIHPGDLDGVGASGLRSSTGSAPVRKPNSYLDETDVFDQAMVSFATAYADQDERDNRQPQAAVAKDRVTAHRRR